MENLFQENSKFSPLLSRNSLDLNKQISPLSSDNAKITKSYQDNYGSLAHQNNAHYNNCEYGDDNELKAINWQSSQENQIFDHKYDNIYPKEDISRISHTENSHGNKQQQHYADHNQYSADFGSHIQPIEDFNKNIFNRNISAINESDGNYVSYDEANDNYSDLNEDQFDYEDICNDDEDDDNNEYFSSDNNYFGAQSYQGFEENRNDLHYNVGSSKNGGICIAITIACLPNYFGR